jgi:hypothetical protein
VLAGEISPWEKTVYRCDDSPDDGEQVRCELRLEAIEETFERTERFGKLIHGARSE